VAGDARSGQLHDLDEVDLFPLGSLPGVFPDQGVPVEHVLAGAISPDQVIRPPGGTVVDEPIPHVNLMGGSVAWRHDGSGFWYTRCADPAGFRQQVWFRELGDTPDRVDLAGPFADERIAENYLSASPDGRWVMDRVQKGDSGEWQVFLRSQGAGGSWWQVADIPDKSPTASLGIA
jgi:hypothetical protein